MGISVHIIVFLENAVTPVNSDSGITLSRRSLLVCAAAMVSFEGQSVKRFSTLLSHWVQGVIDTRSIVTAQSKSGKTPIESGTEFELLFEKYRYDDL